MSVKADIITIGDEILYGQTLDTNSHWISSALTAAGIQVYSKKTINDSKDSIKNALSDSLKNCEIVLLTGGLGPTSDDLTKPSLAEYFDVSYVRNEGVLADIKALFEKAGREMDLLNQNQADIPSNALPIKNNLGTAPGMWFEEDGKVIISMPGVPYEMKRMMSDTVIPKLQDKYVDFVIHHKIVRTVGVPESKLSNMIKDWEEALPANIKLAYLPTLGTVKLRLTSKGNDLAKLKHETDAQVEKLLPLIEKHVYGYDEEEIEGAIGRMLKAKGLTLAVAESCTGGYLSHKITSVPGSSQWFNGGMVPYSNKLKIGQLQVGEKVIAEHGAVSEPVVLALAENVRKAFGAEVGISISGIAGPTGGSPEKPVGTVWIGYADSEKTTAKKFQFTKDRKLNIQFTTVAALNMIRINLE